MTPQQIEGLRKIGEAIVDVVKAADPTIGCPGGVLYAALMHYGCTLNQFEQIMSALVKVGKLKKRGECYFAVPSIPANISA